MCIESAPPKLESSKHQDDGPYEDDAMGDADMPIETHLLLSERESQRAAEPDRKMRQQIPCGATDSRSSARQLIDHVNIAKFAISAISTAVGLHGILDSHAGLECIAV